jgi:hypothetical protein
MNDGQLDIFENSGKSENNKVEIKHPVTGKIASLEELREARERNLDDKRELYGKEEEEEEQEGLFDEQITIDFLTKLFKKGGGTGVYTFFHAVTSGPYTQKNVKDFIDRYHSNAFKTVKDKAGVPYNFPPEVSSFLMELTHDLEKRVKFSKRLEMLMGTL